jgi:large subunit ribosomal protein L17
MKHQIGRKKLNMAPSHRRSMIRNQAILLIEHGHLTTTKARAKEVSRFAEKLVTLARANKDFNAIRAANALMPYKPEIVTKLFKEIAPKYEMRPGGYTRIIKLGRRISDTSEMARVEWV